MESRNEKNYRLLKEMFNPVSESRFNFEFDFGNEPLQVKICDLDGNETEMKVKRIRGNETGMEMELEK